MDYLLLGIILLLLILLVIVICYNSKPKVVSPKRLPTDIPPNCVSFTDFANAQVVALPYIINNKLMASNGINLKYNSGLFNINITSATPLVIQSITFTNDSYTCGSSLIQLSSKVVLSSTSPVTLMLFAPVVFNTLLISGTITTRIENGNITSNVLSDVSIDGTGDSAAQGALGILRQSAVKDPIVSYINTLLQPSRGVTSNICNTQSTSDTKRDTPFATVAQNIAQFLQLQLNALFTTILPTLQFTIGNGVASTFNNILFNDIATYSGNTCIGQSVSSICVGYDTNYGAYAKSIIGLGNITIDSITPRTPIWTSSNEVIYPVTINAHASSNGKALIGVNVSGKLTLLPTVTFSDETIIDVGATNISFDLLLKGNYLSTTSQTVFNLSDATVSNTSLKLTPASYIFDIPTVLVSVNSQLASAFTDLYQTISTKVSSILQGLIQNNVSRLGSIPIDTYWLCDASKGVVPTFELTAYNTKELAEAKCKTVSTCLALTPPFSADCATQYSDTVIPDNTLSFATSDICYTYCGKKRYTCAPSGCVESPTGQFTTSNCDNTCPGIVDSTPGVCVVQAFTKVCYDQDNTTNPPVPMTSLGCQNIQSSLDRSITVTFDAGGKCSSTCTKSAAGNGVCANGNGCLLCPPGWGGRNDSCTMSMPFNGIQAPLAKCV